MNIFKSYRKTGVALAAVSLMTLSFGVQAEIQGIQGPVFDLYAKQFQIATPDGDSIRMWGFGTKDATTGVITPQYPAPTLFANEGDTISITVHNIDIPQQVALAFPGQGAQTKTCNIGNPFSVSGCYELTAEKLNVVPASDNGVHSITYSFTVRPGTYMYQAGVNPQIQMDMGLVGALIVRPTMQVGDLTTPDYHAVGLAYDNAATVYDNEFLFFLSEMDPKLHYLAELDQVENFDNAAYSSTLFFINGRNSPDTLAGDFIPQLPNQPYGSIVGMHPGQRILLRVLNAGRNQHPLHLHGNHFKQIARDGYLIGPRDAITGNLIKLSPVVNYTLGAVQSSTSDLIFEWTGKGLGWDMYGKPHVSATHPNTCTDVQNNYSHAPEPDGYDDTYFEWCGLAGDPVPTDHGQELPVVLPENLDLAFGGFWGGSPYLGSTGTLPVGEGGLNPAGGMVFMWHSHSERELTNNDIYPGGMLTMMILSPY